MLCGIVAKTYCESKAKSKCDHRVSHLRDTEGLLCMPHSGPPASRDELWANESQATTWDDYVIDNNLKD